MHAKRAPRALIIERFRCRRPRRRCRRCRRRTARRRRYAPRVVFPVFLGRDDKKALKKHEPESERASERASERRVWSADAGGAQKGVADAFALYQQASDRRVTRERAS